MIRVERPEAPPELREEIDGRTAEILEVIEGDSRVAKSGGREAYRKTIDKIKRRLKKGNTLYRQTRSFLKELFHGKCAFCETPLSHVAQFRPPLGVREESGRFPLHYAWLAFAWENQHPRCRCDDPFAKGRFPISGKRRAPVGTFGDALSDEDPLLLDPCLDEPSQHLRFLPNGEVEAKSPRGEATIEIFRLNRRSLVEGRAGRAEKVLAVVDHIRSLTVKAELQRRLEELLPMVEDRAEFAGMARQLVDDNLEGMLKRAGFDNVLVLLRSGLRPDKMAKLLARTFEELEDYSLAGEEEATEEDLSAYRARVRLIESIRVKNVKALHDVRIRLRRPDPTALTVAAVEPDGSANHEQRRTSQEDSLFRAPWMMILGENATGKSTLLKLIALTLIGREHQKLLQGEPATYVRQGCKSGFVKVKLSGIRESHQLTFRGDTVTDSGQARGQTLLLAYGTARFFTKRRAGGFKAPYARVDNLFNPQVPLIDVDRWLRRLREADSAKFDSARQALGRVLLFEGGEELFWDSEAKPPGLKVRLKDALVGLDQLSDGYHAVLALVADILSVLLKGWETPKRAEGIVLIDEIGTHLHPRWRMYVVERLREVLPKVQFIATTHDPLCLRGLEDGEVVVLTRSARGHVYSIDDLPPVRALRVDQLLTSEHFGLSSTQDPRSERFFKRYYALLAKTDRSEAEEEELSTLRDELPRHGLAGPTRRERLMLDAIDYYLAAEPHIEGEKRRRASQEALSDVLERILTGAGR